MKYSIGINFRRSRSKANPEKAGVVFIRISTRNSDVTSQNIHRSISLNIVGTDSSVIKSERQRILTALRILCCIIEREATLSNNSDIDTIVVQFKDALLKAETPISVMPTAETRICIRKDLISICKEFRGEFSYKYPPLRKESDFLFQYLDSRILTLKNEGKIGQARNIRSLMCSLQSYTCCSDIFLASINKDFIMKYAEWLSNKQISKSTQSFYLRTLRLVLNNAHRGGLICETSGFFSAVNTRIYRSTPEKSSSLSKEYLLSLERIDLRSNRELELARDMFLFAFYCGGMELIDVANLTRENIADNHIIYKRRLKGRQRRITFGKQAAGIINKYRHAASNYLFPLLEIHSAVMLESVRNYVNKQLKVIGRMINYPELSFNKNISSYYALLSHRSIPEFLLDHN